MMVRTLVSNALLAASALVLPDAAAAQLRLPRLLADGVVMQRDARVPVWGWAAPGVRVRVGFGGHAYDAVADAAGAWRVTLPPTHAGGPHRITIIAGGETRTVDDVLFGDVWVASGQSNMEWTLADAAHGPADAAAANDPMIRHFKVPQSFATRPEADLAGGRWEKADAAHAGAFTAVGYHFARELRRSEGVPIGIINTSWGGSRIEPWMSAGALGLGADAEGEIARREEAERRAILDSIRARVGGALPARDEGLVDGRAAWADPALDEAGWTEIAVPAAWESAGYPGMDGIAWYRTSFQLTEAEARAGIQIGLGKIDDGDISYVNGHEVGRMENAWTQARVYAVPSTMLRAGRNVVAVRVEDTQGGGGIQGDPALLYVQANGARRPLAGTWKFRVGAVSVKLDGRNNQVPTRLWNKMVSPLLGFPIKGVIWYQGESNGDRMEDAVAYRALFQRMITSWRAAWGGGDFPFLWVQLASFNHPEADPGTPSNWAAVRESQSAALALPATAQAVTIDIGEADDIHPRNKRDVGRRLALAARHVAYGRPGEFSGPVYRGQRVEGGRVIVGFTHAGGGLVAGGSAAGELRGFAVAGEDRRWVWASARVENGHVAVWSDRVPHPVAVRYAWADNPAGANLQNREGLPAPPFRTDDW